MFSDVYHIDSFSGIIKAWVSEPYSFRISGLRIAPFQKRAMQKAHAYMYTLFALFWIQKSAPL